MFKALILCCFMFGMAFANEDGLNPSDRPGFGEGPSVVRDGDLQLEFGGSFAEENDAEFVSLGEVMLRYGLTKRVELRLLLNSYISGDLPNGGSVSGMEDSALSMRILLKGTDTYEVGVTLTSSVPTGSDEFGSDDPLLQGALAYGVNLTEKLSLSTSGVYEDGEGDDSSLTFQVATGIDFDQFGLSVGYAVVSPNEGSSVDYFESSLSVPIGAMSQFDIHAGIGNDDENDGFFAGIGFSHLF